MSYLKLMGSSALSRRWFVYNSLDRWCFDDVALLSSFSVMKFSLSLAHKHVLVYDCLNRLYFDIFRTEVDRGLGP